VNLLDKITLEDLSDDQQSIACAIGIAAYINLVRACGGATIYVPKEETLVIPVRNAKIREEYNGYNRSELARKYRLTENMIGQIVKDEHKKIISAPMEGQIGFL